ISLKCGMTYDQFGRLVAMREQGWQSEPVAAPLAEMVIGGPVILIRGAERAEVQNDGRVVLLSDGGREIAPPFR
ncbi:MAG: hypothetical protein ACLGIM_17890, partial [Alphaproteobacteria bacterium]